MKRFTKIMFVVGSAAILFAATAQAQVTSTSDPLAVPQAVGVDITLSGTLQSSLVLTVSGTAGNALSGPLSRNMSVGRSSATFAFGAFNTLSGGVANGTFHRVAAAAGGFAVASLSATVTASGGAAPAVAVTQGAAVNVVAGNARFFAGAGPWTAAADGVDLNAGAASLCGGVCASGTPVAHELAVFLPDTAVGAFSQVFMYDANL